MKEKKYLKLQTTFKIRPRQKIRQLFFSLFIILTVISIIYIATPLSRLGVISFDGLQNLNRADLIHHMQLDESAFFLHLNTNDMAERLSEHAAIRDATIERHFPNRLNIAIVEYELFACATINNRLYYVLVDGRFLEEDTGFGAHCHYFMIDDLGYNELTEGIGEFFITQLQLVDRPIRNLIQNVSYAPLYGDVNRFVLFLLDGNVIYASSYTMPERLNRYFQLLANLEAGRTGTFHMDIDDITILFQEHGE